MYQLRLPKNLSRYSRPPLIRIESLSSFLCPQDHAAIYFIIAEINSLGPQRFGVFLATMWFLSSLPCPAKIQGLCRPFDVPEVCRPFVAIPALNPIEPDTRPGQTETQTVLGGVSHAFLEGLPRRAEHRPGPAHEIVPVKSFQHFEMPIEHLLRLHYCLGFPYVVERRKVACLCLSTAERLSS